jgi:hypothetical protein
MRELPGSSRKWVSKYPLNENRSPIFPERILIGIAIAITIRKLLIDFKRTLDYPYKKSATVSRRNY